MGDTVEGYDDGTYRSHSQEAWKASSPYFHLFPEVERVRLPHPTSKDSTNRASWLKTD